MSCIAKLINAISILLIICIAEENRKGTAFMWILQTGCASLTIFDTAENFLGKRLCCILKKLYLCGSIN